MFRGEREEKGRKLTEELNPSLSWYSIILPIANSLPSESNLPSSTSVELLEEVEVELEEVEVKFLLPDWDIGCLKIKLAILLPFLAG